MSTVHGRSTPEPVKQENLPPGIERLPSGSLRVRVYDGDGDRVTVGTYPTLKEAKAAHAKARTDLDAGTYIDRRRADITIDDWFQLWMPERRVRPNTLHKDWERYRLHIKPYLGHLTLPQLTTYRVSTWMGQLERDGRSVALVKKAHTLLSTSQGVHGAMGDQRRGDNPCKIIRPRTPDRASWTILTRPQLDHLIDTADGIWTPIILLAGYAGLRWSEIAGLQARDYQRTHLLVSRGLTYTPKQGLRADVTKGRRARTVPLPPRARDALNTHLDAHPVIGDGWIFTLDGQPLAPHRMRIAWKKLTDTAGISCRFHDLRHTCASLLLQAGASTADVRDILGHASITTTELYLHTSDDRLAEAVGRAFS